MSGSGYGGNVNIRTLLVPAATYFNQSVTANTDILPTDLNITTAVTSKQTQVVGVYTIEVCFDTAGKFNVITKYGEDANYLGWFADSTALPLTYPGASANKYAKVTDTNTVWTWDTGTSAWVDSNIPTSTYGQINASSNLAAHEIFTFTKVMPEEWNMNFQFSTNATLKWMIITIHGGIY
jgi:hypothetical protein